MCLSCEEAESVNSQSSTRQLTMCHTQALWDRLWIAVTFPPLRLDGIMQFLVITEQKPYQSNQSNHSIQKIWSETFVIWDYITRTRKSTMGGQCPPGMVRQNLVCVCAPGLHDWQPLDGGPTRCLDPCAQENNIWFHCGEDHCCSDPAAPEWGMCVEDVSAYGAGCPLWSSVTLFICHFSFILSIRWDFQHVTWMWFSFNECFLATTHRNMVGIHTESGPISR